MKIKLSSGKKVVKEEIVLASIAVGALILASLAQFISKFSSFKQVIAASGKQIETSAAAIQNAVDKDPKLQPQEKQSIKQQVTAAGEELKKELKGIKEKSKGVEGAAGMGGKKPSDLVAMAVENYKRKIEDIKNSASKKMGESTRKMIEDQISKVESEKSLFANLDKIAMLADKQNNTGLWKSLIEKTQLKDTLSDDKKWIKFIKSLLRYEKNIDDEEIA